MGSKSSTLRSKGSWSSTRTTMRTKLNTFIRYSNPRAEGEVMRACACVWLGKRRLAAESCWYPVPRSCSNTAPHHTCSPVHANLLSYPTHHTFLYLILLTHDYRSSPCYSRVYDNSLLFFETPTPFSIVLGKFWGGGGMDFGDESTQRCY